MSDRFKTQEDVFRFLDIVESKGVGNLIPFPDDLLFHFFNKDTILTDTYIQDAKSLLKLYPKQSGAVKPTALSTGIKLPNSELDKIGKVEACLHHKLADLENLGYIWAGQNSSGPAYATTGLYLTTGKLAYNSYFKGSTSGGCAIWTSALEDDNTYIITTDFNTSNVVMKANKVTIVNNAIVIGSDINGSTTAKGTETLTADIGVLSGRDNSAYVYSSKHKIFWIKFYDKQGALMHEFNFSEGAGSQTFDVVTGNAYDISNINPTLFWNYTQDFSHYNFRYGFTLYQKTGEADIRIPNKKDGTEITPASVPSGYTRIANYKECRQTYNQCESKFKLDDVLIPESDITISGADIADFNKTLAYMGIYPTTTYPYWKYTAATLDKDIYCVNWYGRWFLFIGQIDENPTNAQYYGNTYGLSHPALETDWRFYNKLGNATIIITEETALTPNIYNADPDHVLFTENTGVAKEITIQDIYSEIVDLTHDRGRLYINSDSNKNMMLYKADKGVDTPADLKIWKYVEK